MTQLSSFNISKLYIILCSVFCSIIITGNLIFQKFVTIELFTYDFEVSVGMFIYPFAFLISDIVTEFYGKNGAKFMLRTAILCALIVGVFIYIANYFTATIWSKLDDNIFSMVFNIYGIASIASIIANYFGQMVDISIFAYLKKLTDGRHLWLRNNVSTIIGQSVDTLIVIVILCFFEAIDWDRLLPLTISSVSLKILAAILDTPLCYLSFYLIRKFDLEKD